MPWKKYIAPKPGTPLKFIHNGVKINLRNPNYPLVKLFKAVRDNCPYLELTAAGRLKFAQKFGRVNLPLSLPADMAQRNITVLAPGVEVEETKGPTPEQIVAAALEATLLVKKGTIYQFGEKKVGTKAILKDEKLLQELLAALNDESD